jgi:hypothetical protein
MTMLTCLMVGINFFVGGDIFQRRLLLKRKSKADGAPLPDFRQVKTIYGLTLSFRDFYLGWIPLFVIAVTLDAIGAISLGLVRGLSGWIPGLWVAAAVEMVAVVSGSIYVDVRKRRARRIDLT